MHPKSLVIKFIILLLVSSFTSYSQNNEDNNRIQELYDSAKHYKNIGKYSNAIEALHKVIELKEKTDSDTPPQNILRYTIGWG